MNMHPFDYLSIFVSIIIALGVTHLLSSFARLIHLRNNVGRCAPALIWAISLLVLQVQIWWVSFHRRDIEDWTFFGFSLYLLIPSIVSMLSYLVLPELHPQANIEREYYHNRKWFFGLLGTVILISLIEDFARSRAMHIDANFIFRAEFLALAIAGYFIEAKRGQLIIALAFLFSLVTYIAVVFLRL
jgi:hypothetical protein